MAGTRRRPLPIVRRGRAPRLLLLLGLAMIGPLFSQSAWNNVTFTGGEIRDPGRTLPRAMILGTTSVVLLYLLANVAYVVTLASLTIQHAPRTGSGRPSWRRSSGRAARRSWPPRS